MWDGALKSRYGSDRRALWRGLATLILGSLTPGTSMSSWSSWTKSTCIPSRALADCIRASCRGINNILRTIPTCIGWDWPVTPTARKSVIRSQLAPQGLLLLSCLHAREPEVRRPDDTSCITCGDGSIEWECQGQCRIIDLHCVDVTLLLLQGHPYIQVRGAMHIKAVSRAAHRDRTSRSGRIRSTVTVPVPLQPFVTV